MAEDQGAKLSFERPAGDGLRLRLAGSWKLREGVPAPGAVERELAGSSAKVVSYDASDLSDWDSGALVFLTQVSELCREHGLREDRTGLPEGVQQLLRLAEAVPERPGARGDTVRPPVLDRIGSAVIGLSGHIGEMLAFVGEVALAAVKLATGRARYRGSDLFLYVQQAGAQALPIVTLISFLVGLILAFVGAVQLEQFGANIYVANLVGIGMVRDMGAMMTGIVMAGRTGAAYAAQLGSMKVTQEIDALTTMGISPIEFLVLPRIVALAVMMPLLCLYANCLGILGGATVGVTMLDLSGTTYYQQTAYAVTVKDLVGGLLKASVYGVLIGLSGCLRGLQSGRSSQAVGDATTSAVVTSIVLIIVACGVFAVLFYVMGI